MQYPKRKDWTQTSPFPVHQALAPASSFCLNLLGGVYTECDFDVILLKRI